VSNVLAQAVTQLVSSLLSTLGVAAVMVALNLRLAAVALVTAPLMALTARVVARRTREGFREQQRDIGELNAIIEETLTGQRVVKACGREQDAIRRFGQTNTRLRGSAVRAQTWAGVLPPVINLLNNVSFAVVAAAGGWMALVGLASVGMVAAFVSYSRQFARPLNEIANLYNTIQSGLAGAERVFEVMDEEPAVRDSPEAEELGGSVRGHIEFRSVRFGYGSGEPVLHDVSFEARPGDLVALVGPTGAGKTTVVNLLARFYDVGSGAVLIDGRDVRGLTQDSLRRSIGIVLQETFLFSATVRENIRYGRLDATDAEVENAASLANADSFIRHLPEGYETDLSEEASNLSQGQRQLIAIARAALADPAVLVLDEATSSVDTRTELHVREAMTRLMAGRTSLVIAHRLSTIRNASLILVMDMGRIVERGTHAELLASGGLYQRLYRMHFSRRVQGG
jgi:ATP-binding cassette subfamily B multidrug efflux pump